VCYSVLSRSHDFQTKQNRDEIIGLRTLKPLPGEQKIAEHIPPPRPVVTIPDESNTTVTSIGGADEMSLANNQVSAAGNDEKEGLAESVSQSTSSNEQSEIPQTEEEEIFEEAVEEEKKGEEDVDLVVDSSSNAKGHHDDDSDSDTNEAVGHEEAAEHDQNLDGSEEDPETTELASSPTSGRVSEMFNRLLHLSGAGGTPSTGLMQVKIGNSSGKNPSSSPVQQQQQQQPGTSPGAHGSNPYTFSASALHGGRMICTLPDHPIHAGATAVVAVMIGKTVVVANAGDSRAVLCRDGAAFALSYDHKPQQDVEMNRIRKAGGFVNQFGRVNGNLNLSRSIGDLKYKQAYFLPPAEQMITAEPDIIQ
jgi:hypothetical protein